MQGTEARLLSSFSLFSLKIPVDTSPPKRRLPPQLPCKDKNLEQSFRFSRRDAAFLSLISISPLSKSDSALAFGISGPKDWLKGQKKKASKFLLAPIDASRNSLQAAYILLMDSNSAKPDDELGEIQRLLKSAARDCVPEERNSFVSFQAKTGVEVCTFRLVVKNASSLLDDKNPVKLEAEAMLDDLIRSFTSLTVLANEVNIQVASSRQKLAGAVKDTISSLGTFEQGIKDCLEV
ncbi:hypothetical protein RJ641_032330 [Dillenia turbinata]|uniref:Uncharacterized protein n=1 Tax=Dillenia turbinata TaxID=194707 RepID=A0AAN8ZIC5_9MAGN